MDIKPFSPVANDFIWVAEYINGTYHTEYDYVTKKKNSFYSIDKNNLIRFGLVGHGMKLYNETFGGMFKLNGQMIGLTYKEGTNEYSLTGNAMYYNDIIAYKDAESIARVTNNKEGRFINRVTQYNFGYKAKLNLNGIKFNLKVICSIPFNEPVYLTIWLNADRDLDGRLVIEKNIFEKEEFDAPLKKGVSGALKWVVK